MTSLSCFKTYDIRGLVPSELNSEIAYNIGRAFAEVVMEQDQEKRSQDNTVVIGNDIRLSGPDIKSAVIRGLTHAGVDVIDIGLCGTEEVYFAVQDLQSMAGICVTASHNPADYNGMKFVARDATPIARDNGLLAIKQLAEIRSFKTPAKQGEVKCLDHRPQYIKKLMSFVDKSCLKPLKIISNPGNGGAGLVIDAIESHLPFEFIKIQHQPDGHFPNGVPNPLLPENRQITQNAVLEHKADFGIAWDGDFDRCFFFDEQGQFIEGYYLVGLLAESLLNKNPGETIIYDPRLYWNTLDIVQNAGGHAIATPTGHAFVKQTMRRENAIYGGEMSAHHYFRDFGYCDNGNIPWLLIAQLLCQSGKNLSELLNDRKRAFPCSGEINLRVSDDKAIITALEQEFSSNAWRVDKIDGINIEFEHWRFNVRNSNTEPLLRVNVETKGDTRLLDEKTAVILDFVTRFTKTA